MTTSVQSRIVQRTTAAYVPRAKAIQAVEKVIDDQNAQAYLASVERELWKAELVRTVWWGRFGVDYSASVTGEIARYSYELGYTEVDGSWRICYRFRADTLNDALDTESSVVEDALPLLHAPAYVRSEMLRNVDRLVSAVLDSA
ncbi:MAG: hypothetical protein HZB26_05295 [Candidatus Hydrogenedentes bacterium]|nr:hypothetical protein [Candidatus Hydrogenedentota bacterium]